MTELRAESADLMVTVRADDLRTVLQAADYMTDRSLIGPVDRMGDALALATMRRDTEREQSSPPAGGDDRG